MHRITFTMAALLLSGTAEAKGPKGSVGSGSTGQSRHVVIQINLSQTLNQKNFTQKQTNGNQNGCWWNRCCWFPQQRCCGYYCPADGCWYYYCGSMRCYLPVNCMGQYPPAPTTQPSEDSNGDDTDTGASDGSDLPAGAVNMPGSCFSRRPGR